jgi:hypothetical protein
MPLRHIHTCTTSPPSKKRAAAPEPLHQRGLNLPQLKTTARPPTPAASNKSLCKAKGALNSGLGDQDVVGGGADKCPYFYGELSLN